MGEQTSTTILSYHTNTFDTIYVHLIYLDGLVFLAVITSQSEMSHEFNRCRFSLTEQKPRLSHKSV